MQVSIPVLVYTSGYFAIHVDRHSSFFVMNRCALTPFSTTKDYTNEDVTLYKTSKNLQIWLTKYYKKWNS